MAVKAPLPRTYWILSGLLCLCTLVALWITAWKIRTQKVDARSAGRQEGPSETDRIRKLSIRRGGAVRAGHFKIAYPPNEGRLMVLDERMKPYVTFTGVREGERRAWQELQITCLALDEKTCLVEVEFKPGAPSRGPGEFAVLKEGLRIRLEEDVELGVLRWDPAKPEIYLSTPDGETGLAAGGLWTRPPWRAKLVDAILHLTRD